MTKAPTVRVAELDPNCEGCMAAQRAMRGCNYTNSLALKKIREQADEIGQLLSENEALHKQILVFTETNNRLSERNKMLEYSMKAMQNTEKSNVAEICKLQEQKDRKSVV